MFGLNTLILACLLTTKQKQFTLRRKQMRKVYVEMKVRLVVNVDEDTTIGEVIDEMNYSFVDQTGNADIIDSEILDYEVKDSK
jgi:hypothetical protein